MQTKTILYLYREIMPYNIPVLKALVNRGYEIHVVQDDEKKFTSYVPEAIDGVSFYKKSDFDSSSLKDFSFKINPVIIYISDRTIPLYNKIGVLYNKKKKVPVISGNDTPWYGGKQWFNVLTSFFRHKRFFSHMIVAGMRQYEYAKKLGFSNDNIIFPMNSANTAVFTVNEIDENRFKDKKDLLFVGRFVKVKGLDLLVKAWQRIDNKNGAKLILVGNGDLLDKYSLPDDIEVHKFSNQQELLKLSERCIGFVLPSIFEPWGVVIHEFAAAGLPIIATNVCGAVPYLVINNYNGYVIKENDVDSLKNAISKLMSLDSDELLDMGRRSRELSKSIYPERVAAAILSTL